MPQLEYHDGSNRRRFVYRAEVTGGFDKGFQEAMTHIPAVANGLKYTCEIPESWYKHVETDDAHAAAGKCRVFNRLSDY